VNGKKKSGNTRGRNRDCARIMDEQIWLTEDVRHSRDTRTAKLYCIMASTRDCNSRNSNTNYMKNQIDEALGSYTDDDELTWV